MPAFRGNHETNTKQLPESGKMAEPIALLRTRWPTPETRKVSLATFFARPHVTPAVRQVLMIANSVFSNLRGGLACGRRPGDGPERLWLLRHIRI